MFKEIKYGNSTLLPLTSDIVFKAIFTKEENKDLLLSLLTAYLDISAKSPEDITIMTTEKERDYPDDKLFRLDLRVKTAGNEHIDVEIQVRNEFDIIPRSLHYLARLYSSQIKRGDCRKRPADFGKAITLNFLCYNLIETEEDKDGENYEEKPDTTRSYIRHITFHDRETKAEFTDLMEMVFVELKRMDHDDPESLRDQWTRFFRAEDLEGLEELSHQNRIFEEAMKQMVQVSADEELRYAYVRKSMAELDEAAREAALVEDTATTYLAKGKAEGKEEEKEATAKRMLVKGMSLPDIADITGLSVNAIQGLQDTLAD